MDPHIVYAIAAFAASIVVVIMQVQHQKTIESFTEALKEAQGDDRLVQQLHELAVGVVPVETLHRALDLAESIATTAKMLAPDDLDEAIDAGEDLVKKVVGE